jgi:cation/acetate symporter
MIYDVSPLAITIFIGFVLFVLGISFYFARKTTSSSSYFAAGGTIHWAVNGIAFAGDYLSAASFLGICGMIATAGYDGFLYSIGYLAGWIVALFVVAEPMKRLGKYTFSDALDANFGSKPLRLMAAISTLVVSVFYLIPQMVGAGVLVTPLLGLPHAAGVIMVGAIVILIVATAGMTSTTYVQFLKGALLIIFSTVLVFALLGRGLSTTPDQGGTKPFHKFKTIRTEMAQAGVLQLEDKSYSVLPNDKNAAFLKEGFVKLLKNKKESVWAIKRDEKGIYLDETMFVTALPTGDKLYNGAPAKEGLFFQVGHIDKLIVDGRPVAASESLGPFKYLSAIKNSTVILWGKKMIKDGAKTVTIYYQKPTSGEKILRPGMKFKVDNATVIQKLNFISLMLALFCGTAALPHILIRYYTVPSQKCARKSTIVAIAAIGFFYVLSLFIGMGAMVSGVINITNNNMSAPLLAKSFGITLFSIISAIAFATVLGTVSGLIVAATGAVAHDIMDIFLKIKMTDNQKVWAGKITAVVVGCIAMYLGIIFEGMNVSFLVGWAFAVAASANLPAIVMVLFWKRATAAGISASIFVGMVASLGIILLSPDMFVRYGLLPTDAPFVLNNPAIISIPLSFITLIVVSFLTQSKAPAKA